MEKKIDRTPPFALVPCRSCGKLPRIHYGAVQNKEEEE